MMQVHPFTDEALVLEHGGTIVLSAGASQILVPSFLSLLPGPQ
jgi:hypothetical protein